MGDAVHRLQTVLDLVHLGEVHVFPVVVVVAGLLPHVYLEYLGADDELIAPLQVFLLLEVFKKVTEQGAFRVIDDETCADLIGDAEKVELFAEPPVVPLLDLFEERQVWSRAAALAKAVPRSCVSILFFSSPRQYAPARLRSLNALIFPVKRGGRPAEVS